MRPVVAMVSGGVDSVVLLDVLVAERGADAVTVLHVDHGLRAGSADDADFVRGLHPRVVVERLVNGNGSGEGSGEAGGRGNLQGWARGERYRLGFALAEGLDADLAVGHTASDQVETVLYRLAASPGRRALLGMAGRDGRLVRPLLGWTREDVLDHAGRRGLRWREDPSNASDAYARNRARHHLVPALRTLHPAAEANVLRTVALLRDEAVVLDAVVEEALASATDERGVDVAALAALPGALRRLCLQRLADEAFADGRGNGSVREAGTPPAVGGRADEVVALAASGGTRRLDLGAGLVATVTYGRLRVAHLRQPGGDERAGVEHVGTLEGAQRAAPLRVPGSTPFLTGAVSAEPATAGGPRHADVLDVRGDLTVRTRRPSDRMAPLGMGGRSKSLQDLFVDRKVPAPERDRWPVVCAGEEVVWVPGVATSERARVTDATPAAVRLRWDRVRSAPA